MFQKMLQGGGGGISELSQVFIGIHPHSSGSGYKNWDYCFIGNRDLVSYSNGTIIVLKDFNGFMYFNTEGNSDFKLEVNGNAIATNTKYEGMYNFHQGDTIKQHRTSTSNTYQSYISIVLTE